MASFPDLRHGNLSSDSTEGSRVFRKTLAAPAALFHAADAAFVTVSELATFGGAAKARSLGADSSAGRLVGKPLRTLHSNSKVGP